MRLIATYKARTRRRPPRCLRAALLIVATAQKRMKMIEIMSTRDERNLLSEDII